MRKVAIIIATIRSECFSIWAEKWQNVLKECQIIIIEDNPKKSFKHPLKNAQHYSWEEIDNDLREKSWIIPRRTAAIRSYGFYKAVKLGFDCVITLDDDCYPLNNNFLEKHMNYLYDNQYSKKWIQHSQSIRVRGFPTDTEKIEAIANMGLWSNIPDFDGITQKDYPNIRLKESFFNFPIPFGYYAPISSMNFSLKSEAIPACYFLLMGEKYGFDRFDDIWSGIFLKKICDKLNKYICGGEPFIWHDRASNVDINIKKESMGMKVNEYLWKDIDKIEIKGNSFKECYIDLANKLPIYNDYWKRLQKAMLIWANLF